MKKLLRIAIVLVLLVIVGVSVLYFYRNSLIRSAVEKQATASLGVKTTLGGANLSLFGGTLNMSDFKIGSPKGYAADQMFTLGGLDLGVNYGDLRGTPIRVKQIVINKPTVVLENVNGKFNFQAMMDNMGGASTGGKPEPKTEDGKEPIKLIVDELTISDATVLIKAIPPLLPSDLTVAIPSVTLKEIGNADGAKNGAAIKDVVAAAISALAAKAATMPDLKNFGGLSDMLNKQASAVMGNISKEMEKQVNQITSQVNSEINKAVGDVTKSIPGGGDVGKMIPGGGDVGKMIPGGGDLGKLIPGGDKKKDKEKK